MDYNDAMDVEGRESQEDVVLSCSSEDVSTIIENDDVQLMQHATNAWSAAPKLPEKEETQSSILSRSSSAPPAPQLQRWQPRHRPPVPMTFGDMRRHSEGCEKHPTVFQEDDMRRHSGGFDQMDVERFVPANIRARSESERNSFLVLHVNKKNKPAKAEVRMCTRCGSKDTPQWRNISTLDGLNRPMKVRLCNACGLHFLTLRKRESEGVGQSRTRREKLSVHALLN